MPNKIDKESLNNEFKKSIKELERATRKAKLIRKIDLRSRVSAEASPEELAQILKEIKAYREEIKKLDQQR